MFGRIIIFSVICANFLSYFETHAGVFYIEDEYLSNVGVESETNIRKASNLNGRHTIKIAPRLKRSSDLVNTLRGIEEVVLKNLMDRTANRGDQLHGLWEPIEQVLKSHKSSRTNEDSDGQRNNQLRSSAEKLKTVISNRPYNKMTFQYDLHKPEKGSPLPSARRDEKELT